MRQIKIGNIMIDAVTERDGPWRQPKDFFPVLMLQYLALSSELHVI